LKEGENVMPELVSDRDLQEDIIRNEGDDEVILSKLDSIKESLDSLTDKKKDMDENEKIMDALEIKSKKQYELEKEGLSKKEPLLEFKSSTEKGEDKSEKSETDSDKKSLVLNP